MRSMRAHLISQFDARKGKDTRHIYIYMSVFQVIVAQVLVLMLESFYMRIAVCACMCMEPPARSENRGRRRSWAWF